MKKTLLLLAVLYAGVAQAQSMYRWVDQEGQVHYGDRPPPGKAVEERKYSAPSADRQAPLALRQAVENFPVVVHVTTDCAAPCQEGRDYLNRRGIPFSEKTIATNEEIAALHVLLGGGDLSVPVLQVGEKLRMGFLEAAWAGMLDAAGYPKAATSARR
jgi:glutaredoxin